MFEKLYEGVSPAVGSVVEMMGHFSMQEGSRIVAQKPEISSNLVTIIGLLGETFQGSFLVHYNESMALRVAKEVFQVQSDGLDDDVQDSCGEVANIICGSMKKNAVDVGFPDFKITVPTVVVVGTNLKLNIRIRESSVIFPFSTDKDHLTIEMRMQKTG